MSAKIYRNDPCPCGSGKKYKRCCEEKDLAKPEKSGMLTFVLLALLVAGGAAAVVFTVSRSDGDKPGRGRVWSAEHGHWHDAPAPGRPAGRRMPLGQPSASGSPGSPAPPGTPPPGKVWSVEHGHWHDAAQSPSLPPVQITVSPQ